MNTAKPGVRKLLARLMIISSFVVGSVFAATMTGDGVAQAAAPACGTVLVSGGSWLSGVGVAAHSNGASQGTGNTCAGLSTSSPSTQDGYGWQCVELAARLYVVRGWGTVRADGGASAGTYRYGAKYIPEGSPSLTFHANGSGYVPVPGDLIVEGGSTWGHVAIVDSVSGSTINAVEQNASTTGRHAYALSGSTITGGYSVVRGVEHSPNNTNRGGGTLSGYEMAFQANTAELWSVGLLDMHGTWGAGMMPGTSPAVVKLSSGGYEMAFQANTGVLWTIGSDGHGSWGYGMMRGTSPAIAALPGGGYEVGFQANTGALWSIGADMHGNWGFGMASGTSPSIAAVGGTYEMAFQANTGALWSVGPAEMHGSWGAGMASGISPAIAACGAGYEMAFQANTGALWSIGADGHGSWGYGMAAGTNPTIASVGGSYEMVFQANTGALWSVGPADMHGTWGYGMATGTNPAIG